MAATKLLMGADEDSGDKLSSERISYAREFNAAAAVAEEEEEEEEDVALKAVSNNRLVLPFTEGSSSTCIAAEAHPTTWREIAVTPGSCHVDAGMELSRLKSGNLDDNYSFVTEGKKKASMRTYSEELACVIEQRFSLQHMQAMIDLPSYPPSPANEEKRRVQLQTGKMQGGGQDTTDEMVECLQQSGIIPATLDVFKPRCTLHINYKSTLELKIGDCVFLHQMSEGPPNVAILENNRNQQASTWQGLTTTLFTVMMVALDLDSEDGDGQYLHWILANISNQSLTSSSSAGVEGGNELVVYESPKPEAKRRTHSRYLFVAYAQQQPSLLHLCAPIKRSNFNLRSFATAHAFNSPVAALYVIAAPNP